MRTMNITKHRLAVDMCIPVSEFLQLAIKCVRESVYVMRLTEGTPFCPELRSLASRALGLQVANAPTPKLSQMHA